MLVCEDLHWPARSVAWHPSGQLLAVGFHESLKGGVAAKKKKGSKAKATDAAVGEEVTGHTGAVHIYQYLKRVKAGISSYELVKRAWGCSSTAWIADVKFSHVGDVLAVCSHDKHMYLYKYVSLAAETSNLCRMIIKL